MKTYVFLSPEKLKFINSNPAVQSLLYDLGLLPEEISARIRGIISDEREHWAKRAEGQGLAKGCNERCHKMIAQMIREGD
ncbi:MAG: hypothetical protein HC814_08410 [Rhodobacteraceae bacterium]|nr:hypothetical protein [Paracoccaceae bacterium]